MTFNFSWYQRMIVGMTGSSDTSFQ